MRRAMLWLPLTAFVALLAVVASGLFRPDDHLIHSRMVGHALPDFTLPAMVANKPGLADTAFGKGQPRLLNIFASWCIPCMAEAPQLMALKQAGVPIDGVAVRDTPGNIQTYLARYGDPYQRIGDDRQSSLQLALGSSGVPESYLIDGRGHIVEQHIGDIRPEDVPGIIAKLQTKQ
jgi:cytochrome c biogenesis protein CcmG/thiol:disulfide interchange protein DsbE